MPRRELLEELERTLEKLTMHGVRYLSLPHDKALARMLREHMTPEHLNSEPHTTEHFESSPIEAAPTPIINTTLNPVSTSTPSDFSIPSENTTLREPSHSQENSSAASVGEPPTAPTRQPPAGPGRAAVLAEQLRGEKSGSAPGQATLASNSARDEQTPMSPAQISTLESLSYQFRNCGACNLAQTRNRLVFGVGHSSPRLMLIGEGPGAEEDAQGLPFVGRAGQLLNGFILALGLTREDVYITNVVKCRPPGNRNPEPTETSQCRPILLRQIELLNPALIVTLGNVPLKALRPEASGITRERGQIFRFEGYPVLPTFHPSFLLRQPSAIGECWRDFRKAFLTAYGLEQT